MFPLSSEVLQTYLPHRPPMIWIDRVLKATSLGGTCDLLLCPTALYFQSGKLIPSAPIEWIAQAAGYCAAARIHSGITVGYKKLGQTFLVGIRDAKLPDLSSLQPEDRLVIEIEIVKQLAPLALVKGTIASKGQEICSMVLKVYGQSDLPAMSSF